jgi:hypothetical protein
MMAEKEKSGVVLHCPHKGCHKPFMKDAALADGTRFIMRCSWCVQTIFVRKNDRDGIVISTSSELSTV